ncbi:DUF3618 domain-containing protein [Ruania albidiflava]|uniref:DUF3618 domain-containing protein n=1 Tax=Ruania albidiflava TaxID=366586 RepID=UPI0003B3FB2E|nr:DUF3618 domain-containing protein [Ruania albidiflava]
MSERPKKRTVAEIEADLQRTREELTRTVDQLSDRVDPRRQVEEIRNQARQKFADVTAQGKSFADDVKAKDPKALGILGAVAAVAAAITTAAIVRRKK